MEYFAKRYDTGQPVRITVRGTKVQSVTPIPSGEDLPTAAPGLFDIQINGGLGYDFSSETITVGQAAEVFRQVIGCGVFRFCPTFITNSAEAYRHGVLTLMELVETYPEFRPVMAGIHLEGPFIANETGPRGSHPPKYCVPYNADRSGSLPFRRPTTARRSSSADSTPWGFWSRRGTRMPRRTRFPKRRRLARAW